MLNVEEDSLQEHMHYHSLIDPGHTHSYHDNYAQDNNIETGNDKGFYMDEDDVNQDHERLSESANTGISITIDGVSSARTSSETRPKNMRVVYIMKIC